MGSVWAVRWDVHYAAPLIFLNVPFVVQATISFQMAVRYVLLAVQHVLFLQELAIPVHLASMLST